MSKVSVLYNGYGSQTKYKVRVFGSESSTYIREQIADILKPKNIILVSELKELLSRVDPSTNFYNKNFGSPDYFGWDDTNIESLCNDVGCEIICDCAPHPVKIKVQDRTNGKFKIKEDLMIDFDRWRSSCDGKTMGYVVNDKPKAHYKPYNRSNLMGITKVIFNPPATIVFWEDGTKTVVKCGPDDEFNPHVGIAMCVMKRVYGGRYVEVGKPKADGSQEVIWADNFHSIFRKWADPWVEEQDLKAIMEWSNNFKFPSIMSMLKNFEAATEDQKAEDDE